MLSIIRGTSRRRVRPHDQSIDPPPLGRRSRRPRSRGQAMVEFALVFPLFILLLAGMIDFGMGLYSYMTLINSARDGARLASTTCAVTVCGGPVKARVIAATGGLSVSPDCDLNLVGPPASANKCTTTAKRGDKVTVTATYDYHMIWPLTFGNTIHMTSQISYMVE